MVPPRVHFERVHFERVYFERGCAERMSHGETATWKKCHKVNERRKCNMHAVLHCVASHVLNQ